MIELQLHGSSMLYFIPLNRKQLKWDARNTWYSALELANDEIDISCKDMQTDYLVLDLSYTACCEVAVVEDKAYSVNQKNKGREELKNKENIISVKYSGLEPVKKFFDRYIEKVKKHYKNIILVRTECPQYAINRYFVQSYSTPEEKRYNKTVKEFEEYFIEQVSPVVIDISRFYYHDLMNQKYGPFVSYEQGFYDNVGDILNGITLRDNSETYFAEASYKYILKRYLRFYDVAWARGEQKLLLDDRIPLNQIVKAMNKKMVEKYIFELSFLARQKLETFQELMERAKLFPSLYQFVQIVKHIYYDKKDVAEEDLGKLLGEGLGLEVEILNRTREYYKKKNLIDVQGINLSNLKEFYEAMKADKQGEYDKAVDWMNQAVKKFDARIKPYKTLFASEEEFANGAAYYACNCAISAVDIWGHFITKYIGSKDNPYCRVENIVDGVSLTKQDNVISVYHKLLRSEAKWFLFDLYFLVENVGQIKNLKEQELQEAFDKFILFAKDRYGKHIIMHKLQIKTSYIEEHGNSVEFTNSEKLKQDGELLEKWQNYIIQNLPCHVIDTANQYVLKRDTCIVNDGVNYGWDYLESVTNQFREIVRPSITNMKIDNYLDAVVNFSLGNDLIVAMLAGRYSKTNFTLFAYNEYGARPFREFDNLQILTGVSAAGIKQCKKMLVLESGAFEKEQTIFRGRRQKEMMKKAKKIYPLKADLIYSVNIGNKSKGDGAVVFVRNLKNTRNFQSYEEKYREDLTRLCKEFAQHNKKVCLMSTGYGDRDGAMAGEILDKLEPQVRKWVQTYSYQGNIEETLGILQGAEYILGSGYHEIALGFLMEKTVYPIVCSDKIVQMLEDSGFQGKYCDLRSNDNMSLEDIESNGQCKLQADKLTDASQKQLAALDKVFLS